MNDLNNVQNDLKTLTNNTQTWIQKHERLIVIILVLSFGYLIVDKATGLVAQWDNHKASEAVAALNLQKEKTDAELAQAKQMLENYQTQLAQATAENLKLTQTIASRNALLAKQQQEVPKLQPKELAQVWSNSVAVDQSEITPTLEGYTVTPKAAIATVQALNAGVTAIQNLQDEQTKNANLQKEVDSGTALITQGKIAVNGLQLQLQDQQKSCSAEITAEKAKARKGKLKAFGLGFVIGYVVGHIW